MCDTSQDTAEDGGESIGDLKNRLLGKIAEYAEPKAKRETRQLTFHSPVCTSRESTAT